MDISSSTKPLDALHRQMLQFWQNAGLLCHLGLDLSGNMEAHFLHLVHSLEETSTGLSPADPRDLASAPWAVKNIMLDSMDSMERHLKIGMAGLVHAVQNESPRPPPPPPPQRPLLPGMVVLPGGGGYGGVHQNNNNNNKNAGVFKATCAVDATLLGLSPNKDMAVRAVDIAIVVSCSIRQLRSACPGIIDNNGSQPAKVSRFHDHILLSDVREEYWAGPDQDLLRSSGAAAHAHTPSSSPFDLLRPIVPERAFRYARPVPDENMSLLVCVVVGWALGTRAMLVPAARLQSLSLAQIINMLVLTDTLLHRQRPLVAGGPNGVPPPVYVPSWSWSTPRSVNRNNTLRPPAITRPPFSNNTNPIAPRPFWAGAGGLNNRPYNNSNNSGPPPPRPPLYLPPQPYQLPSTSRHYTPPMNHRSRWAVVARRAGGGGGGGGGSGSPPLPPLPSRLSFSSPVPSIQSSWSKVLVRSKKGPAGKKKKTKMPTKKTAKTSSHDSDSDSGSDSDSSYTTICSNSDCGNCYQSDHDDDLDSDVVLDSDADEAADSSSSSSSGSSIIVLARASESESSSDSDSDADLDSEIARLIWLSHKKKANKACHNKDKKTRKDNKKKKTSKTQLSLPLSRWALDHSDTETVVSEATTGLDLSGSELCRSETANSDSDSDSDTGTDTGTERRRQKRHQLPLRRPHKDGRGRTRDRDGPTAQETKETKEAKKAKEAKEAKEAEMAEKAEKAEKAINTKTKKTKKVKSNKSTKVTAKKDKKKRRDSSDGVVMVDC